MTTLAQCYAPRHDYATALYLNFDGWQARGIAPFQATNGSNSPADRDRDIQDILFQTAQVFAPFNVKVLRRSGDGSFENDDSGCTTVFIGADRANMDGNGVKYTRAYTPGNYMDYPSGIRGVAHRPNSDPYDLAFVDPVGSSGSQSTSTIVQGVAHEAGHTFGLAHVLSYGEPDVMSYDSPEDYFVDTTYDITDLNYNPSTGQTVHNSELFPLYQLFVFIRHVTRQDSYTYLETVLGPRPPDDFANAADPLVTVYSGADFNNGFLPNLSPGQIVRGAVDPVGDHDVFNVNSPLTKTIYVNVFPDRAGNSYPLDPMLLVYDLNGPGSVARPFAFNNDWAPNDRGSYVQFTAQAGHNYRLVVGAEDGSSGGGYALRVDDASTLFSPKPVIWVGAPPKPVTWVGAKVSPGGTRSPGNSLAAATPLPATAVDALRMSTTPNGTSTGAAKLANRRVGSSLVKDLAAGLVADSAKPSGPRRGQSLVARSSSLIGGTIWPLESLGPDDWAT
jgi:hypothetical protein